MIKFKTQPNRPQSPEAGYTLIESLVAMIMVSALMAAIAPVIALSVGTRVQARRVELAVQAARSYIDRVRSGEIDAPKMALVDPAATKDIAGPGNLECPEPPDPKAYCTTTVNASSVESALYCVDGGDGGDCTGIADMVVYAVGFNHTSIATDGYKLFLRVYRGSGVAGSTLSDEVISTSVSNTGLATRNGETEKPLFTTQTEITPIDNSFQNYRNRL
ncbi:MAG: type II secretion system protein [Okeania sp. SIO3I5]|uniref:hormogonium polysaccharide secretion pseudopilin HpsB n=1 Tax=Okeania sp. SIO3I5 TaxID=2607805 RepID=UPI0013BBFBD6|nr:hormogonium polysaccharide secretion pseudopilin HpsB [Okeania sp. SIO3I5]NEQ39109.1 type II secretion system protein [Okeania sp. SIO3I5]